MYAFFIKKEKKSNMFIFTIKEAANEDDSIYMATPRYPCTGWPHPSLPPSHGLEYWHLSYCDYSDSMKFLICFL